MGHNVIYPHAAPRDGKRAEPSYATALDAIQAVIQALVVVAAVEDWTEAYFAAGDGSAGLDFACPWACAPHLVVAEECVVAASAAACWESSVSHFEDRGRFPRTAKAVSGSRFGAASGSVLAVACSVLAVPVGFAPVPAADFVLAYAGFVPGEHCFRAAPAASRSRSAADGEHSGQLGAAGFPRLAGFADFDCSPAGPDRAGLAEPHFFAVPAGHSSEASGVQTKAAEEQQEHGLPQPGGQAPVLEAEISPDGQRQLRWPAQAVVPHCALPAHSRSFAYQRARYFCLRDAHSQRCLAKPQLPRGDRAGSHR